MVCEREHVLWSVMAFSAAHERHMMVMSTALIVVAQTSYFAGACYFDNDPMM